MTRAIDSFDKAVARAIEILQAEGFGVLTNIEPKNAMKNNHEVEEGFYRFLNASSPPVTHRLQTADQNIVMLLPSSVFVREEVDGRITIGLMNPAAVLQATGKLANGEFVQEVRHGQEPVCAELVVY